MHTLKKVTATLVLLLDFVALEQVVLLAATAVGALEAANEKHGDTHRDQHGEYVPVHSKPMDQAAHTRIYRTKVVITPTITGPARCLLAYWFDVGYYR